MFDEFEVVERANTIKKTGRSITWRLRRTARKMAPNHTFIFSQSLYDQLNLANNSLMQLNKKDANGNIIEVFLGVCQGDNGVWAKKTKKGRKGKSFKNAELASGLDTSGITSENLDLESFGVRDIPNHGTTHVYRIIEYTGETPQVSPDFALPTAEIVAESVTDHAPLASQPENTPMADVNNDEF